MASTSYASISSSELSHLVLEYLQSEGFSKTFEQFQQEAAGLLQNGNGRVRPAFRDESRHATCRPLRSVLSEYLSMAESEQRKRRLVSANPLAKHIYNVLEEQEILQSMQQHRHDHQGVHRGSLSGRELSSSLAPPVSAGAMASPLVSPGTIRNSIYGQQMRVGHGTPSRSLFGSGGVAMNGGGVRATNGGGAAGGGIQHTPSPQRNGRKKSTPRKRKQASPAHHRDRVSSPSASPNASTPAGRRATRCRASTT